jgi:hypothetical protein
MQSRTKKENENEEVSKKNKVKVDKPAAKPTSGDATLIDPDEPSLTVTSDEEGESDIDQARATRLLREWRGGSGHSTSKRFLNENSLACHSPGFLRRAWLSRVGFERATIFWDMGACCCWIGRLLVAPPWPVDRH